MTEQKMNGIAIDLAENLVEGITASWEGIVVASPAIGVFVAIVPAEKTRPGFVRDLKNIMEEASHHYCTAMSDHDVCEYRTTVKSAHHEDGLQFGDVKITVEILDELS